jgi:hypothetical protein
VKIQGRGTSRRGVLGGLVGSALVAGGLVRWEPGQEAAAKKSGKHKTGKGKGGGLSGDRSCGGGGGAGSVSGATPAGASARAMRHAGPAVGAPGISAGTVKSGARDR